jgi:hypothetical protein
MREDATESGNYNDRGYASEPYMQLHERLPDRQPFVVEEFSGTKKVRYRDSSPHPGLGLHRRQGE